MASKRIHPRNREPAYQLLVNDLCGRAGHDLVNLAAFFGPPSFHTLNLSEKRPPAPLSCSLLSAMRKSTDSLITAAQPQQMGSLGCRTRLCHRSGADQSAIIFDYYGGIAALNDAEGDHRCGDPAWECRVRRRHETATYVISHATKHCAPARRASLWAGRLLVTDDMVATVKGERHCRPAGNQKTADDENMIVRKFAVGDGRRVVLHRHSIVLR